MLGPPFLFLYPGKFLRLTPLPPLPTPEENEKKKKRMKTISTTSLGYESALLPPISSGGHAGVQLSARTINIANVRDWKTISISWLASLSYYPLLSQEAQNTRGHFATILRYSPCFYPLSHSQPVLLVKVIMTSL